MGKAEDTELGGTPVPRRCLPPDEMLRVTAEYYVLREVQCVLPIDDLTIRIMRVLRTERRPTDKAFEHDRSDGPPVATEGIALTTEDLRCNVVGRPYGRVGHDTARFAPSIDLATVADGEVDLVKRNRVAVPRLIRRAFQQLLVIRTFMLLMKASGETKVCKLDVSTTIKEDVIRLNVTVEVVSKSLSLCQ